MIKDYLRSRGAFILLLTASFGGLLALVTFLLVRPWDIFFNTVLLGFLPLIIFIIFDFSRFYRQWNNLKVQQHSYQGQIEISSFPMTRDPIAQSYRNLLAQQTQTIKQLQTELTKQQAETFDTLQLWTHQIKTPLTALDLLLQVDSVNTEEARLEINQIDRYLKVMLNYLKLTNVNTDLVLTKIPLKPLVKKTIRDLAKLFISKDLRVEVADLPAVISDSQWLSFIFEQILTNAIKYTHHGKISVYSQGQAIIFADTGIGILPEDLPRIFEQGYSGYNGRTNQKASGLGLYLSNEIAQKLGLKLTAASQVGLGTQIALTFPQKRWDVE